MSDNESNSNVNNENSIWKLQTPHNTIKLEKKQNYSNQLIESLPNPKDLEIDDIEEFTCFSVSKYDNISALSGLCIEDNSNATFNKANLTTGKIKGHCFVKKNFHKPLVCHHCAETLWGLLGTTGYICQICNYLVHEKCVPQIIIPCNCVLSFVITEPAAHCWSEISHFKRKFCNVCRKRLEDVAGLRCEICEYYVHTECFDFAISNCKQCAIASTDWPSKEPNHHFREGNLPINSKCFICKKICASVECLTGLRCEWCGITVHTSCYRKIPIECTHGILHDIILPASAVSLPRTSSLIEQIYEIKRPKQEDLMAQTLVDDFSDSDSGREESGFERKSVKEKRDKEYYDFVRLYDGMARFKKKQCRYLSLGKSTSVQRVIEMSMKAFQLPFYEINNIYLVEINEKDNSDKWLKENEPFKKQLQFDMRRPQVILKLKTKNVERDHISIYPGDLTKSCNISINPIKIPITVETDATTILVLALRRLGLEHMNSHKFHLVETSLDCGITERVIEKDEILWTILERLQKESLRAFTLTRFYIRSVADPYGTGGVAVYVGNLKKGLSQRLYERILIDRLTPANRWNTIEVIYYDSGSLVLIYSNAEKAEAAYNILKESTFDDNALTAIILPRVETSAIPNDIHPLLVFVNVKSGGCQGTELISSFRKLLNPHQVFNLDYGGPLPGLHCYRNLTNFKILVCGGDGTVGWVLSCLDNVGQDAKCPHPPMAIVPLGTGNDLARVLRWGTGYTGAEDPLSLLKDVVEAEEIRLDRWTVMIKPNEMEKDEQKRALQLQANAANTNEETTRIFLMNNYFGLGIDADLNLDFHLAREENPGKFTSRIHNKGIYFKMGLRKMVNRTKCKDLHHKITLEVDGRQIELPPLEGIIILNILSWGAGANPWGFTDDVANQKFSKPTHYDGMLEVVGVTGVVHMGQIFSGLRTGTRLAQGGHIRITLKTSVPVQVDGEPWIQSPCQITVLRSALKATMLKKRKRRKVNRRNTEPGIPPSDNKIVPNETARTQISVIPGKSTFDYHPTSPILSDQKASPLHVDTYWDDADEENDEEILKTAETSNPLL